MANPEGPQQKAQAGRAGRNQNRLVPPGLLRRPVSDQVRQPEEQDQRNDDGCNALEADAEAEAENEFHEGKGALWAMNRSSAKWIADILLGAPH